MSENWEKLGVFYKSQKEVLIEENFVNLRHTDKLKDAVARYYHCRCKTAHKCKFQIKIREDFDMPNELEVWKKGRHDHELIDVRYRKLTPGQQRAIEAAVVTGRGVGAVRKLLKNYKEQPMTTKRISNALQLEKKRQKEGKPRKIVNFKTETTPTPAPGILAPMTASQPAEGSDGSPPPVTNNDTPKLSDFMIPTGSEAKYFDVGESSSTMRRLKQDLLRSEIERNRADTKKANMDTEKVKVDIEKVKADMEKLKMDWERSRIGVEILKLQKEKLEIELERIRGPRNDGDLSAERGEEGLIEERILVQDLDEENI